MAAPRHTVFASSVDLAGPEARDGPTLNIPTALTLIRVAAVPLVTIIFFMRGAWVAPSCCTIFICAAITDWADGFLARKLRLVSSFGAFLDPVADKLMVAAALVLLCVHAPPDVGGASIAIPATIIIGREITISALREHGGLSRGMYRRCRSKFFRKMEDGHSACCDFYTPRSEGWFRMVGVVQRRWDATHKSRIVLPVDQRRFWHCLSMGIYMSGILAHELNKLVGRSLRSQQMHAAPC